MNQLDHSVLIAAAPEAVWSFLSDLNQNPSWQSDCQSVVFLSKQRNGKGARWRYRNLSGREFELEITAWYDGLGYEYRFLDGSAHGRLRLQEIAEGTTVQWTFSYEPRGRLGGMRNALGLKRKLRKYMNESLRALQASVQRTVGDVLSYEARSLMRDVISYDARVNYRPRHPSRARAEPDALSFLPVEEPPLREEDTRPNPAYVAASENSPLPRQPVEAEPPTFLEDLETPRPRPPRPGQMELSIWEVFGLERPEPVVFQPDPKPVKQPPPPSELPPSPARAVPLPEANTDRLLPGHPGWRRLQRQRPGAQASPDR